MGGVRNLIRLETDHSSSEATVLNINLQHKPVRGGELLFHCAGLSHLVISNTCAPSWTVVRPSSVHGILHAGILECVAISYPRGPS